MTENRQKYLKEAQEGSDFAAIQVKEYDDLIEAHKFDLRERICMALIAVDASNVVERAAAIVEYINGATEKPKAAAIGQSEPKKHSLNTLMAAFEDMTKQAIPLARGLMVHYHAPQKSSSDPHGTLASFEITFGTGLEL